MSKRVNRDDIDKFHDYGLYIPTRTIRIDSVSNDAEDGESGTDNQMLSRTTSNLHILESINSEPITIIMNNIGGYEYDGLGIYDLIKASKSKITIKAIGNIMSMGSVIFQAADVRIMYPKCVQMIHYGTAGYYGHAKDFHKWAEQSKRMDDRMEVLYLDRIKEKHPEYTLEDLRKLLAHDTFFTAKQSVALGLADKIEGGKE